MTAENTFEELNGSVIKERNTEFLRAMPWLMGALALSFLAWKSDTLPYDLSFTTFSSAQVIFVLCLVPWCGVAIFAQRYYAQQKVLLDSRAAEEDLLRAERSLSIPTIDAAIIKAQNQAELNMLIDARLETRLPILREKIRQIRKDERRTLLNKEVNAVTSRIESRLAGYKNALPIYQARAEIEKSLGFLEARRDELQKQWNVAYEQFSWWNKLKYSDGPDFSEIDRMLKDLRFMDRQMERQHGEDFVALEKHFELLKVQATSRVLEARSKADDFIREQGGDEGVQSDLLRKSLWFSMLSIPASVWSDVDRAADVFDAVRGVNGQFVGMPDSEIWWETLFLPTESLAGLAALTKGAYFERLVAVDTGGVLHEHFNHPGTDVVIDGTEFQLKATDSESYVNSIADGIPVIATSEVAVATGSIDSGYTNEELTNAVDLALGSTIVDFGDTAVDAILAGVGGLGLFATIDGLNHAVKKHENGGDGVEAMFEGAGVAIEGTARALVGAAEMGYKALSSRPSRFVGRALLKGLVKLDEKMTGQPDRK